MTLRLGIVRQFQTDLIGARGRFFYARGNEIRHFRSETQIFHARNLYVRLFQRGRVQGRHQRFRADREGRPFLVILRRT